MKNMIKFLAVTAALVCCTAAARADEVDQVLEWLGKQGAPELCRKADAGRKIYSLRSFDGTLCRTTYIAALAETVCSGPNTEEYSDSQCHKYAVSELKGREPAEVLKEAVKNSGGKAKEFACGRAGVPDAIKAECPK
jgi:hypothetical protein